MNVHEELDERDHEELVNSSKGATTVNVDLTFIVKWVWEKVFGK